MRGDDGSRSRRGGAVTWRAASRVSGPFRGFPSSPTRPDEDAVRDRPDGVKRERTVQSTRAETEDSSDTAARRGAVASVTCRPDTRPVDMPIPPQKPEHHHVLTVASGMCLGRAGLRTRLGCGCDGTRAGSEGLFDDEQERDDTDWAEVPVAGRNAQCPALARVLVSRILKTATWLTNRCRIATVF